MRTRSLLEISIERKIVYFGLKALLPYRGCLIFQLGNYTDNGLGWKCAFVEVCKDVKYLGRTALPDFKC